MKLVGIYGASGFGREVMPLARAQLTAAGGGPDALPRWPPLGLPALRLVRWLAKAALVPALAAGAWPPPASSDPGPPCGG